MKNWGEDDNDCGPDTLIFPVEIDANLDHRIPEKYRKDFNIARTVLRFDPSLAAVKARYSLELLLKKQFKPKSTVLKQIINEVEKKNPQPIGCTLHAFRESGNFGAHRIEDQNGQTLLEVDDEEANLTIGVLKQLLEHFYIANTEADGEWP